MDVVYNRWNQKDNDEELPKEWILVSNYKYKIINYKYKKMIIKK